MTRHPRAVGESYWEHLIAAVSFGAVMIAAGVACLIHGLLPFVFESTGSRAVAGLHVRMARRKPAPGLASVDSTR